MRDVPRMLSLSRVAKGIGVLTHKGCTLREKRGVMQSYLPTLACFQVLDKEVTTGGWDWGRGLNM